MKSDSSYTPGPHIATVVLLVKSAPQHAPKAAATQQAHWDTHQL